MDIIYPTCRVLNWCGKTQHCQRRWEAAYRGYLAQAV